MCIFVRDKTVLKYIMSIFIIFMIAIRPVLPLVNYAVNYDYITKNLCENRAVPQSTCKGKCYLEKELSRTEKQSGNVQVLKVSVPDHFLTHDILSVVNLRFCTDRQHQNFLYSDLYTLERSSGIFHPPLS